MMVSPPWATTSRPFSLNSTGIAAYSCLLIAVMGSPRPHRQLTSLGKYLTTQRIGLGAAWPSPHMDASAMAPESSSSSPWSQRGACIRFSALAVPTRHGVHWPQDSSEKNFITLAAAARALSLSDKIITAADPMKQPY